MLKHDFDGALLPSVRRRRLRKEARAHIALRRALHGHDTADHGDR
jgi:hypothetical protein